MIQFSKPPSKKMLLVDSNILVYSLNSSSEKCKKAQDFLQKNQLQLCVAQQNIFETLRVLTHLKSPQSLSPKQAVTALSLITKHFVVINPLPDTEYLALELIARHHIGGNQIFDAYLVATALSHGVTTIVTDNTKDFKMFEMVRIINPFED